jgi:hypothetical protein
MRRLTRDPVRVRRGLWLANAVVVIAVLGTLGAIAFARIALWPTPARHRVVRELPPPAAGAFEHGGQPLADPALAAVFGGTAAPFGAAADGGQAPDGGSPLTDFVLATDDDRSAGGLRATPRTVMLQQLLAPPAITAHGAELTRAWGDMIGALARWVYVPQSGRDYDEVVSSFKDRVRAVSDRLAAAGLGYYLEGDVITSGHTAHALVYAYRVESVGFVAAHGEPRRVLELRRLDHLNFAHAMMGMQSEDLGDPVLLLDQIDEHVAHKILPVLSAWARYPLGDAAWAEGNDSERIGRVAGVAVRGEILAALQPGATEATASASDPGPEVHAAVVTAELLTARDQILETWGHTRIDAVFVPDDFLARMESRVPHYQWKRVHEIEDALALAGAGRIGERVQQLIAASVRRHEAQHGLDADRDPRLPYPDALAAMIGPSEDRAGQPRNFADHCRNELSAYVSQIANDPITPKTTYFHLASFAFDRRMWGTPESYAAVIISEALARHLAPDQRVAPVIHDGYIDRLRLIDLAQLIAATEPELLHAAARDTWHDLYGEDLTAIVDR